MPIAATIIKDERRAFAAVLHGLQHLVGGMRGPLRRVLALAPAPIGRGPEHR